MITLTLIEYLLKTAIARSAHRSAHRSGKVRTRVFVSELVNLSAYHIGTKMLINYILVKTVKFIWDNKLAVQIKKHASGISSTDFS